MNSRYETKTNNTSERRQRAGAFRKALAIVALGLAGVGYTSLAVHENNQHNQHSPEATAQLEDEIKPTAIRLANRVLRFVRSNPNTIDEDDRLIYATSYRTEEGTVVSSVYNEATTDGVNYDGAVRVEHTPNVGNRISQDELISITFDTSICDRNGEEVDCTSGREATLYGPAADFGGRGSWEAERSSFFELGNGDLRGGDTDTSPHPRFDDRSLEERTQTVVDDMQRDVSEFLSRTSDDLTRLS
jgi:hypothetical protein